MTRLLLTLVFAVTLAGCTTSAEREAGDPTRTAETTAPPPVQPRVSAPADLTTVLKEGDAVALALAVSRQLFDEAPVVVTAPQDQADQVRAASVAADLGAPMLVWPQATPEDAEARDGKEGADNEVVEELERLQTDTLLAFGDAATSWPSGAPHLSVVRAPADAKELAALIGRDTADVRTVTADEAVTVLAESSSPGADLLELAPGSESTEERAEETTGDATGGWAEEATGDAPEETVGNATGEQPTQASGAEGPATLAEHDPPEPLESVQALVMSDHHHSLAAVATAVVAGAEPIVMADPDPRATQETIAALAESPPERVLALGEDFGDAAVLRYRLDVAATGVELPGGGQVLFPDRRFVALYGHPHNTALGALGAQPLEATQQRARDVVAEYEPLSDVAVIPAFEIITTIASSSPGQDGDYSRRTDINELRPWVDAARDAGFYVVLDLQPGRADFLSQAQDYEELLVESHVGLALDPEWRLAPDQVHMRQIGSVDADEVNAVVAWLADLTREHALPQKLLVLHQFKVTMLPDRERIDMSRDELAVLIHMDGHGSPALKRETWDTLTADPPSDAWWGWKNFYDEDDPTMTPEQTLEFDPEPLFISYQ